MRTLLIERSDEEWISIPFWLARRAVLRKSEEKGKIAFYLKNQLLFTKKLYTIKGVEPTTIVDKLGDIVKKWNG